MKTTKTNIAKYVKFQLKSNPAWATKALVRIFTEGQTPDEQVADVTRYNNNVGFSGADVEILSSFAKQYMKKGRLSDKQMALLHKKISKYSRQVINFSDTSKLTAQVAAFNIPAVAVK